MSFFTFIWGMTGCLSIPTACIDMKPSVLTITTNILIQQKGVSRIKLCTSQIWLPRIKIFGLIVKSSNRRGNNMLQHPCKSWKFSLTVLCTHQVVEHSHESLKLLLPDLPLGVCRGPVSGWLWDSWACLVFPRVQHHQIIWPSSAGQCSHLK